MESTDEPEWSEFVSEGEAWFVTQRDCPECSSTLQLNGRVQACPTCDWWSLMEDEESVKERDCAPVPSSSQPDWDDAPVTVSLINNLTEAHPEYRTVSHIAQNGNRVMMIEMFEDGERIDGLAGDFVSLVSNATENEETGDRSCLMGHDWCDGPDGETVDGEAFGGLCGECHIKQSREKHRHSDET